MGIQDKKDDIREYLSSVKCNNSLDRLNVCAHIFTIIERYPEHSHDLFEYFLSTADDIEGENSGTIVSAFSIKDKQVLEEQYGEITDNFLEFLLKKNLKKHEFYEQLWNNITTSLIYETRNSKIFAVYYIWIDARIPYYYMEPSQSISMDDVEFSQRTEKLHSNITKVRFILNTNYFTQRTERASTLLALIDSLPENEDRCVLMAHTLSYAGKKRDAKHIRHVIEEILKGRSE